MWQLVLFHAYPFIIPCLFSRWVLQTAEVPWIRSVLFKHLHSWLHSIWFLFLLFQIQDGSWHESHFFFHTQDSRQLPIVDIQTFPAPRPSSQRHVEISPVCFFWHWHPCHVACAHATLMQGGKMAAYQRASIGVWRLKRDPAEGCDSQRVLMSTDNCIKCVLWTTVSETVLVLAVNGLLQLPDHRVGPSSSQSQSLKSYLPLAPHQTTLNRGRTWRSEPGL